MKIHQGKFTDLSVFISQVLAAVKKISKGRITTYKFLARAVGQPKAIRAVANALGKNPYLIKIPCHRVVRSDGRVGGYCLGANKKICLLKKEGIKIEAGGRIKNFKKVIYKF